MSQQTLPGILAIAIYSLLLASFFLPFLDVYSYQDTSWRIEDMTGWELATFQDPVVSPTNCGLTGCQGWGRAAENVISFASYASAALFALAVALVLSLATLQGPVFKGAPFPLRKSLVVFINVLAMLALGVLLALLTADFWSVQVHGVNLLGAGPPSPHHVGYWIALGSAAAGLGVTVLLMVPVSVPIEQRHRIQPPATELDPDNRSGRS